MNRHTTRLGALYQVQAALALFRDGELPEAFRWEEFKYQVIDPAIGNDPINKKYNPNFCGIMDGMGYDAPAT